jgi:uncharacterized membrane protein YphA (DoxX/SURF4 family)
MPPITLSSILQVVLALGLFNVWLLRSGRATAFRGGDADSLRQEFKAYGLPEAAFFTVGALKLSIGALLLAGLWVPELVLPAAAALVVLMLGALSMHLKVRDPLSKSVPALCMLAMSGVLVAQRLV